MSANSNKLTSILKRRKPLEDVEFREESGSSPLREIRYFGNKELFCLDPLIKHLRNRKKPPGLFAALFSPPPLDVVSLCFCKYCLVLGLSDGSVVLVDPRAGDLLSHTMINEGFPIQMISLIDMKWMDCRSDFLLLLSDSQLHFFNPDQKTCKRPLQDVTNCKTFVLFESAEEQLQVALLCHKAVLIVAVQPDQTFAPKQIFSLDESPTGISVCKSSVLLQYPKDIERIMLASKESKAPVSMDHVRMCSQGNLLYVEELEVFAFQVEGVTYFLPEKGPFDINSFKLKWDVPPTRTLVVDPYIIGLSDKGVEMHHYYMPNTVKQFDENLSTLILASANSDYVGLLKEITDTMPSLFLIAQRTGKTALCKFDQATLEDQCAWFVKASEYKLALNMCDVFTRRKYKRAVTAEEYVSVQRERGYHLFLVDKNYKKAKRIFEKYETPAEEVILLFAELLHRSSVERLMEVFAIDQKATPSYCSLCSAEDASVVSSARMKELAKQLKVFLLFFLEKRKQIVGLISQTKTEIIKGKDESGIGKEEEKRLEKYSFLKMMYEMVFFHGCLILLICKDPDASLVLKEFKSMLSEENSLPPTVCEDLLLKYELFPLLFQFLVSKRLYSRVFSYLKEFYGTARKPADTFMGDAKQHWIVETVRCAQEVNKSMDEQDFLRSIQWLFDTKNIGTVLDCLKVPPDSALYSPGIISYLSEKGGIQTAISHLEYIAYKTQPPNPQASGILADFYMNAIEERARTISSRKGEAELDLDEINNDAEIVMIRNKFGTFLENSRGCDVSDLLQKLPAYLLKEKGMLLVRMGRFKEGFEELIREAQLPLFAIKIAEEAFVRSKNMEVLTAVIKSLFDSYRVGNCLRLAVTLMERYYDTYSSLDMVSILPEDIETEKVAGALARIMENEVATENRLAIERNCQNYELLELRVALETERGRYAKIEGEERCRECGGIIAENETMLYISHDGGLKHYVCGKSGGDI